MDAPIIGREALASGSLSRWQLRWNYQTIFPDVYFPRYAERSLEAMTIAAWLWSERRSTITGRAAAALHGAKWVSGDHHRLDRGQYVKDIRRAEALERLGWHVIRVIKEDRPRDIVERAACALTQRGYALAPGNRNHGRGAA